MSEQEEKVRFAQFAKVKARAWEVVLYPESMISDWQDKIAYLVQLPFAYCVHDKDLDDVNDERKIHVHVILVWGNTTTGKSVIDLAERLAGEGKRCCGGIQAIRDIRNMYEYLIHNTDDARKKNKHLYDKSERICGNNFDIGQYVQLCADEKEKMALELFDLVIEKEFINFVDFMVYVRNNFEDTNYMTVARSNASFYEKLTKGHYQNWQRRIEASNLLSHENEKSVQPAHEIECPECGSLEVRTNGKTPTGRARMRCKACGKSWVF